MCLIILLVVQVRDRQAPDANDFVNAKSHAKENNLLAGYVF